MLVSSLSTFKVRTACCIVPLGSIRNERRLQDPAVEYAGIGPLLRSDYDSVPLKVWVTAGSVSTTLVSRLPQEPAGWPCTRRGASSRTHRGIVPSRRRRLLPRHGRRHHLDRR